MLITLQILKIIWSYNPDTDKALIINQGYWYIL